MNVTTQTYCLMVYYTFCFNYTYIQPLPALQGSQGPVPTRIIARIPPQPYQHFRQDANGQYTYGYSTGTSAKIESRQADGTTIGGYSYEEPDGQVRTVQYIADADGFRPFISIASERFKPAGLDGIKRNPLDGINRNPLDGINRNDLEGFRNEPEASKYVPRGHQSPGTTIDTAFKYILDEDTIEVGNGAPVLTANPAPPAPVRPVFDGSGPIYRPGFGQAVFGVGNNPWFYPTAGQGFYYPFGVRVPFTQGLFAGGF